MDDESALRPGRGAQLRLAGPASHPHAMGGLRHPAGSCRQARMDWRHTGKPEGPRANKEFAPPRTEAVMVALVVLLLILAILGGMGFAAHFLWLVLIAAVALWALGFLVGGVESGVGRRRWYGRW